MAPYYSSSASICGGKGRFDSSKYIMSRSFKRHPVVGHTRAKSDKPAKVMDSRRVRRNARQLSRSAAEDYPDRRELTNPYSAPKDGKQWWDDPMAYRK